ncbi:MAG: MarR family transcriptional regulator [Rhodospirillales bacterium]|nr:MarR family transcriptional regulator [Rhodospirillales bacterium]
MKHDHRSGALDASALHLLHRAGQCAEVLFTNEAAKADLTPRQFAVLVCVAQNPDVSQTGLVEQTGVDRSTLADVVRRLVKKGLLQESVHGAMPACTRCASPPGARAS